MKKLNDFVEVGKSCYYLTEFLLKMQSILPTLENLLDSEENEGLYYGTLLLYSKLFLESDANFDVDNKNILEMINMVEDLIVTQKQMNFQIIKEEFSKS